VLPLADVRSSKGIVNPNRPDIVTDFGGEVEAAPTAAPWCQQPRRCAAGVGWPGRRLGPTASGRCRSSRPAMALIIRALDWLPTPGPAAEPPV